jgi:hypothetical protein
VEGAKQGEPGFCNPATDKIKVEWSCLVDWCATCIEGAKLGEPGFCNSWHRQVRDRVRLLQHRQVSVCAPAKMARPGVSLPLSVFLLSGLHSDLYSGCAVRVHGHDALCGEL